MSAAKRITHATSGCWPDGDAVSAVRDIPGHCTCTWVPAVYSKRSATLMTRKYAHTACPAATWHRRRQPAGPP